MIRMERRLTDSFQQVRHRPSVADRLVAWRSGGVVRRMNEVTPRWLVLAWVTVFGRVCHVSM